MTNLSLRFSCCFKNILFLLLVLFVIPLTSYSQQLKITEVYYDGTNERIEITNQSTGNFNDQIQLSGLRTSNNLLIQNVVIPSLGSIVLADDISVFLDQSNIVAGANKLTIADTQDINIDLIVSGALIDSFFVSQSQVTALNNLQTSFERLQGSIVPTIISRTINIVSGYIANPLVSGISIATGNINGSGSTTGSGSNGSGGTIGTGNGGQGNNSGTVLSGTSVCNNTGTIQWSGLVMIDEVHLSTTGMSSYIELMGNGNYSGELLFSGTFLQGGMRLNLNVKEGQRIILASSNLGFHHTDNVLVLPFGHNLTGTIVVYDALNNFVDSVYVMTGQTTTFYESSRNSCFREFGNNKAISPGFDDVFLSYQGMQVVTNTVYIPQPVSGTTCTSGNTTQTGINIGQTGNIFTGSYERILLEISLIGYNPLGSDTNNERLGVTYMSGSDPIYLASGWSISYDGKSFEFTQGILTPGQQTILTENFRFVNSRQVCVDLIHNNQIYDTLCYDPAINSSPYVPGQVTQIPDNPMPPQESSSSTNIAYKLTLGSILYNPEGSDTNREHIEIISGEPQLVDLTPYRIRINGRNKRIDTQIQANESLTITKTWGLSNSKYTCVELIFDDTVIDTKCYDPSLQEQETPQLQIGSTTGLVIGEVEKNLESGTISSRSNPSGAFSLMIVSVEPNPLGKDTADGGREEIQLLLSGQELLHLHSGAKLVINGRQKGLSGVLQNGQALTLTGNFGLPNSASCVDLLRQSLKMDRFCYPKPKDGYVYLNSETQMEKLSNQILTVIKKIKQKKSKQETCVYYQDYRLNCLKNKKTKIYKVSPDELRVAKAYIRLLEQELKDNRYPLWSSSVFSEYASIYRQATKRVKDGQKSTKIKKILVKNEALELQHTLLYNRSNQEIIFDRFSEVAPNLLQ